MIEAVQKARLAVRDQINQKLTQKAQTMGIGPEEIQLIVGNPMGNMVAQRFNEAVEALIDAHMLGKNVDTAEKTLNHQFETLVRLLGLIRE